MKVTLPTINDAPHQFAKDFAALVEKDSGGRIKGEVYPASQLGSIPRQIEGVQFGAIQVCDVPPEFFVGVDERFEVMAAPGLVDSIEHGQRVAADPAVRKLMLGARRQQRAAWRRPDDGAADLHHLENAAPPSRRFQGQEGPDLRLAVPDRSAFERLGATPVAMTLGDVLPALQQGAIDGAIAGIGPFVHLHFGDAAKYVTETNSAGDLHHPRSQPEMVRHAAEGLAGDRRSRRRRGVEVDRAGGGENVPGAAQGLDRRRRRADQPAARRTGRR